MEMRFLLDSLEAVINGGKRVGFGRILLEEGELLDIVDQMRAAEPTEVTQARRVLVDREQILTQAQIEADSIVTMARDRVNQMLSDDGLVREAKAHAEQMLSEALGEARKIRSDADGYATDILVFIEDALVQNLDQVRRGLEHLRSER
jgi:hypothetical protein